MKLKCDILLSTSAFKFNLRRYHLVLFVCGVFVYPICSFLGLPFTHAATVRSITHLVGRCRLTLSDPR